MVRIDPTPQPASKSFVRPGDRSNSGNTILARVPHAVDVLPFRCEEVMVADSVMLQFHPSRLTPAEGPGSASKWRANSDSGLHDQR